jgi:hypothetical protein
VVTGVATDEVWDLRRSDTCCDRDSDVGGCDEGEPTVVVALGIANAATAVKGARVRLWPSAGSNVTTVSVEGRANRQAPDEEPLLHDPKTWRCKHEWGPDAGYPGAQNLAEVSHRQPLGPFAATRPAACTAAAPCRELGAPIRRRAGTRG